jgi:AraC-like DNA-binding protein
MPSETARPDEYQTLRRREVRGARLTEGTHRSGGVIPWHTHDDPTMCLVLHGRFSEYSSGHVADCHSSSLKFMPAGERHWNSFHVSDVHGFMAELQSAPFSDDSRLHAALSRQAQFVSGREVVLAHRLYREFQKDDSAAPLAMEGLLLDLVAQLARTGERIQAGDCPAWARRAREIIHEHVATPLSVAAIAEEVGVHPATLARGFRRIFGCSIGDMQRRLRLELALVDLADTEQPLAQVALRAGFYDQSHFTNLFRRSYGTTPARYRRELARD